MEFLQDRLPASRLTVTNLSLADVERDYKQLKLKFSANRLLRNSIESLWKTTVMIIDHGHAEKYGWDEKNNAMVSSYPPCHSVRRYLADSFPSIATTS